MSTTTNSRTVLFSHFKRRISTHVFKFTLACVILSAPLKASSQPPEINAFEKDKILKQIEHVLERKAFALNVDFSDLTDHFASFRQEIETAKTHSDFAHATQKALEKLEVSHTFLLNPRSAQGQRKAQLNGKVGIYASKAGDRSIITRIVQNSPAYQAGLRKLDEILTIDGYKTDELKKLENTNPDFRKIEYKRGDDVFQTKIEIRSHTPSDPPSIEWIDNDIAIIRVMSFADKQFHLLKTLELIREAKTAKGIIIDIRGNFGGRVFNYNQFTSHFCPKFETTTITVNRRIYNKARKRLKLPQPTLEQAIPFGKKSKYRGFKKTYKGEIVVLTDSHCSSAADLLPAVLHERAGATVIGQKTHGALLKSYSKKLSSGYALQYPFSEIVTANGIRLEKSGHKPDIELSIEDTANDALIYKLAVETIQQKSFSN